ncbi:hypothetical protein [Hyalangium rubrum]|uniref:Lipoprotein n=1 Tax=Hyalangium rubrum TaxID=3103134 RepID=A0ABU5H5M0_9BACT|nr:hypothetical protein [Hyalangium sp. s54d21]MDY7228630.1 hypothetical protein [Hyalangium sp. s54d21]
MYRLLPLAPLLWLLACNDRDLCAESPLCEENRAVNCEPSCTVGPCSNGPNILPCGESAMCSIVPGDINSQRFFRSRALCVQEGSASCDPTTSGAPTCDGQGAQGIISGCSEYKRVIRASCTQAGLYFSNTACCQGEPTDGGTPDGGTSTPDGGTSTDGGR